MPKLSDDWDGLDDSVRKDRVIDLENDFKHLEDIFKQTEKRADDGAQDASRLSHKLSIAEDQVERWKAMHREAEEKRQKAEAELSGLETTAERQGITISDLQNALDKAERRQRRTDRWRNFREHISRRRRWYLLIAFPLIWTSICFWPDWPAVCIKKVFYQPAVNAADAFEEEFSGDK